MDRRLTFQAVLESLVPGRKVYFQPPEDMTMVFPCIKYELDRGSTKFADNVPYGYQQQYEVMMISRQPDPVMFGKLAALPMSTHAGSYVADNLNHSVFSIYF